MQWQAWLGGEGGYGTRNEKLPLLKGFQYCGKSREKWLQCLVCTLPCQIRTARCLLGPVMKCTPCWFLQTMFFASCTLWVLFGPRFFTFTSWNFEINQGILDSYWNAIRMHPAVFIQTVFFCSCILQLLFRLRFFKNVRCCFYTAHVHNPAA